MKQFIGKINGKEYTDKSLFLQDLEKLNDYENLEVSYSIEDIKDQKEVVDEQPEQSEIDETATDKSVGESIVVTDDELSTDDVLQDMHSLYGSDIKTMVEDVISIYSDLQDFKKDNEKSIESVLKANQRVLNMLKRKNLSHIIKEHYINLENISDQIYQLSSSNENTINRLEKNISELEDKLTNLKNNIKTCEKASYILDLFNEKYDALLDDTEKYLNGPSYDEKDYNFKKDEPGLIRLARLIGLI